LGDTDRSENGGRQSGIEAARIQQFHTEVADDSRSVAGHYVQTEHANNIQPERRRLLRALFANGAYAEGWAEYIAQVMMDEGFLNSDPRSAW